MLYFSLHTKFGLFNCHACCYFYCVQCVDYLMVTHVHRMHNIKCLGYLTTPHVDVLFLRKIYFACCDITKVDTLYLMTNHARQNMGMLRKSCKRETLNLLVCANSNTDFLHRTLFFMCRRQHCLSLWPCRRHTQRDIVGSRPNRPRVWFSWNPSYRRHRSSWPRVI